MKTPDIPASDAVAHSSVQPDQEMATRAHTWSARAFRYEFGFAKIEKRVVNGCL